MAFEITQNAFNASQEASIELNIVFEIDGVDTLFGSIPIKKFARVGDPDLEIGDPETNPDAFYVGGFNLVNDQESLISLDGTTTTIKQQLQIDRGKSSGVPNFQVNLVDEDGKITLLITPDETQTPAFDLSGRSAKIYLGFVETAWPEDYITIFRGAITDIISGAGTVQFSLNSPDNKKRKTLFVEGTTDLSSGMGTGDTVANVDSTSDFLTKITPPGGGSPSANFETYIKIDDEIMKYETVSGSQFQSLTRAQFNTTAATHSSGTNVKSVYQITGNVIDLSLQLMLSGWNGDFVEDIEVGNFNVVAADDVREDVIFFGETNLESLYGIVIGDFITTTGATNGANNVTEAEVTGLEIDDDGNTIVTVGGAGFVDEVDSPATMAIRSQYDVFPDGIKMRGDEVDIAQHLFLKGTFLPSFEYDFRLTEQIDNGNEFIEEELYSPVAAFTLPRKARASAGFHSGPIPGQNIQKLNSTNVKNAKNIKIKRSTERFFYNEIVYRFDKEIDGDDFLGGVVTISQESKDRIINREKTLTISSEGMTTALSAPNVATISSNRRISRYKFGAENLVAQILFNTGFTLEVGDIVLFDGSKLQVSDIKTGTRDFKTRLMEIDQKVFDIRKGEIRAQLVDTNFDGQSRFCLIGPSSIIKTGLSLSRFIIQSSFGSRFGDNEFQKWERFVDLEVRIRSIDFTTRNETRAVANFSGNTVILETDLSFTPQAGDIMELTDYSTQTLEQTLVFGSASLNNGDDFNDGEPTYVIL